MECTKVHVGATALIKKNNKILLVKRATGEQIGYWGLPGGRLEFCEDPATCVKREIVEEVGLNIKKLKFINVTNDFYEPSGVHWVTLWFECTPETDKVKLNGEATDFGWFSWENLPQPLFQPLKNFIEGRCLK